MILPHQSDMASEAPVSLKKVKRHKQSKTIKKICVIHYPNLANHGVLKTFTEEAWENVQKVKTIRLESDDINVRCAHICDNLPENPLQEHAFHRPCLKSFTNLKYVRLDRKRKTESDGNQSILKRRCVEIPKGPIFPDECIICERKDKYVNRRKEKLIKCQTESSKLSISEAAHGRADSRLIGLTDNYCLISREAKYHESCRKKLTQKDTRYSQYDTNVEVRERENAHQKTFQYICHYVNKNIIEELNVERMTMLRERYLTYMQENFSNFYNENYKTYKLKEKLIKTFGNKLMFWQPNFRSELVYSSDIPSGQAIESAFELAASQKKRIQEAAFVLRREIIEAYKNTTDSQQWPPSAGDLIESQKQLPHMLTMFLRTLFRKRSLKQSDKCERLVTSISQDICHAVTNGKWMQPKHLLLGMTLRHITGSAKTVTIVNRFGNCASNSALLELETAMCDQVTEVTTTLPTSIQPDKKGVVSLCWDNFDLNEETVTGHGTTHSTHGIVIQQPARSSQYSLEEPSTSTDITCYEIQQTNSGRNTKNKKRSVTYKSLELQPCFVKPKADPRLQILDSTTADSSISKPMNCDLGWIFLRAKIPCKFPAWKGWLCMTSKDEPHEKSVVDYMPPIDASINDNSTVQRVLQISKEATQEFGQSTALVTFDLAVAKKAYNIIWQNPEEYQNVSVHLGAFHTMMSYLGALGKLMRGSGIEEIIVEAGICARGSLEGVLTGKHFNRSMRVHSILLESFERLLFESFEHHKSMENLIAAVESEFKDDPSLCANEVTESAAFQELSVTYFQYRQEVKIGRQGQTAQFIIQYMERVWNLVRFDEGTRSNDVDLYTHYLGRLCPLFFSMNHHNYARYATYYFTKLLNVAPDEKSLLKDGGLSVGRSCLPKTRTPIDLTIEQTINRHAKTKGGIIGFSTNRPAYYRWCVTRHSRASYVEATQAMLGLEDNIDNQKELSQSSIEKSELSVQKTINAIRGFINPFEIAEKELICLSSGLKLPNNVAESLITVESEGKKAFDDFIQYRLIDKSKSFHHPIEKANVKTFSTLKKEVKISSDKCKTLKIAAQRDVFGQLLMLSQLHNIDLHKVMSYPLSPVPWALATGDGSFLKTNKATLLHRMEKYDITDSRTHLQNCTYIVDGNAVIQALVALPETFGELALKLFKALPKSTDVHFVTDRYIPDSIKSTERSRRGDSSANLFLIGGPSTKLPSNWKLFLSSGENKISLMKLILQEWESDKYASLLQNKRIFFVVENTCIQLSSEDGIITDSKPMHELNSSHEEADTKIIVHCIYAAQHTTEELVVRSPDTDVFLLLLAFAKKITSPLLFDTGTGNSRRLLNITDLSNKLSEDICGALLGFHSFTGCDTTSCFAGKGKIRPFSLLIKRQDIKHVFSELGNQEVINQDVLSNLEKFVCMMYGDSKANDVNKMRADTVRKRFTPGDDRPLSHCRGIDLSQLPPCKKSLLLHIKRANFQAMIWKQAASNFPEIPNPEGNGWKRTESGSLVIDWFSDDDILPAEIVDILADGEHQTEEDSNEEIDSVEEWFSDSDDEFSDCNDQNCQDDEL